MTSSILYRQQSSIWLNELSNKIIVNQNRQSIEFFPSTVLALYLRRKFFVSYRLICNNDNYEISSTLLFADWIDLLFNGDFRQPINVTEWPMKFH